MGVSSSGPVVCYALDSFLLLYCVIATALLFMEKVPLHSQPGSENDANIYQELSGSREVDPYQVLEPTKRKRKAAKKKRPEQQQQQEEQTLVPGASASPQ